MARINRSLPRRPRGRFGLQPVQPIITFPPSRVYASLLDVCRLRLRLLDLLHRLCGSLVDVEGELDVVVVDANAIVHAANAASPGRPVRYLKALP